MMTDREVGRESVQHGQGSAAGRGYGALLATPSPGAIERARITDYARWLSDSGGGPATSDYTALWQWSVSRPAEFWASIWDYFDVLGSRGTGPVISGEQMPDIKWFSGFKINYARNALRAASTTPDAAPLVYPSEAGPAGRLTYAYSDRRWLA